VVVSVNRDETLKKAETLLRQGKLAGAIEEYVRLIEALPKDWNSINVLGDLYVRAGDVDRAVAQFTAVADHLYDEGFFPKASALYKKALKTKSNHEHSLARLLDIARLQGLTAEAKTYQQALWHVRGVDEDSAVPAEDRAVPAEESAVPTPDEVTIEDIRVEPATFDDANTVPLLAAPIEDEPTPSYLVEDEDSDDRFVVTSVDRSGGEAMLQERADEDAASNDGTIVIDQPEADIGDALSELRAHALVLPPMPIAAHGDVPTLEDVFGQMRARVAAEQDATATEQYERGMRRLDEGEFIAALDELQAAARAPSMRFKAAGSLGRVLASHGEYKDAVEWMERAIEAPPSSVEEGRSLLYELADALEHLDEHGRAMAILLEVQADAGAYRDVAERIDRLKAVLHGSSRA
jgi:tetratricopeptide (TPR) repeat protein